MNGAPSAAIPATVGSITSRMIRDVSGGVRVEDDVSPEGLIWIDGDNFNSWLKPKIGQCQADGSFKIVSEAREHVAPDPYSIYPNAGKCTASGLVAPDGKSRKNVI